MSENKAVASVTVAQIMRKYNFSHVYVMRALSKGWLVGGHKVAMAGSKVMQWSVPVVEVEAWRARAESHKAKGFSLHADYADANALREQLANLKPADLAALRASLEAMK